MSTVADLQSSLDKQTGVITQLEAEVATLKAGDQAQDFSAQVAQLESNTARMQALLPAEAPPAT